MPTIKRLLALVKSGDGQKIELARDNVKRGDLAALAKAYWTLETWDQKDSLVQLIQDHIDPRTRTLMLDILKAPEDRISGEIDLTRAIALCHLDKNFANFTLYADSSERIAEGMKRYLGE